MLVFPMGRERTRGRIHGTVTLRVFRVVATRSTYSMDEALLTIAEKTSALDIVTHAGSR